MSFDCQNNRTFSSAKPTECLFAWRTTSVLQWRKPNCIVSTPTKNSIHFVLEQLSLGDFRLAISDCHCNNHVICNWHAFAFRLWNLVLFRLNWCERINTNNCTQIMSFYRFGEKSVMQTRHIASTSYRRLYAIRWCEWRKWYCKNCFALPYFVLVTRDDDILDRHTHILLISWNSRIANSVNEKCSSAEFE